ncbi:MAG: hypothetical protein DRG83_18700 [Deltaproteobacteria bacterium]|nr:MAG: hypothetical protein DRG83_18700 [Deltaproteobacteria bacterium]
MRSWGSIDEKISVRDKAKALGIFLLGQFHLYRLREKSIVIFATRRGGSTLLMEMIASQPGIDFIGEPLNLWRYRPYFDRLPHPPRGRFISLSQEEARQVRSYFEDLLSGRIKAFNSWNPFHPTWSFRVRRLVVKLFGANTLIDWLGKEFDIEVLYLLRHSVPVALSCLGLNWGNDAEAYLQNPYFREQILGSERAWFADEVLAKGSPLEKFVLEWCLENFYPLQVYKERPWSVLTYEEVISRPKQVSELICSRFDLPDPERMARIVGRPSGTTFFADVREAIVKQGPQVMLGRWLKRVSQEELSRIQEILDVLGIRAYQAFYPYPAESLCHFGPLSAEQKLQ